MWIDNEGSLTIRNCEFVANNAFFGGGMGIANSSPTLIACRFIGNCQHQQTG